MHVERAEREAQFWLEPFAWRKGRGFGRLKIGRSQTLVEENAALWVRSSHEYFGN
jgi:hypothetical protein